MKTPLKAIKAHCVECMGGVVSEVKLCTSPKCELYRYRLGKNSSIRGRIGGNPNIDRERKKYQDSIKVLTAV